MRRKDYPILSKNNAIALEKKVSLTNDDQHIVFDNSLMAGGYGFYTWFKPSMLLDSSTGVRNLMHYRDDSSNVENGRVGLNFIDFGIADDGKLAFQQRRISDGANFQAISNRVKWNKNQWYHVFAQNHPARGMELYINGVLVGSNSSLVEPFRNNTNNVYVGTYGYGRGYRHFNGEVKRIGFIKQPLEPKEVYSLQTYTPNGNESWCTDYFDFSENNTTGVNGNTANINNPFGIPNNLIIDTPITDYYGIKFNSNNNEHIDLGTTLCDNIRAISLRVKVPYDINTVTNNGIHGIIGRFTTTINTGVFILRFFNGNIQLVVPNGGTYNSINSTNNSWVEGEIVDITIQFHSTLGRVIYINGVLQPTNVSQFADSGTLGTSTYIGRVDVNAGTFYSDIQVSHLQIWDRELTLTEIQDNINRKFYGSETDLKFYAQMLQGEGDKIYDFKDDTEGILNSTGSTNDMWELSV